jgi:signal transduction histidine kinase
MVHGDVHHILRAVVNLITNAIHASSTQGRQVCVSLDSDSSNLTFRVTDNGTGIPAARLSDFAQNNLFDRSNGGPSGLGLFIADWIVRTHGGRLQLFSQTGIGTTAELIFPASC